MNISIGIVRETKSYWERRTPLIPDDVKLLLENKSLKIFVQPSERRIFSDQEYTDAGAIISEDLSGCDILVGIKEVKIPDLIPGKIYMFFSHTIKGQAYNMPMLQKILDFNITLIDYEKIENEQGQRLIFFSLQAGLAGIIDTIWALGQKYNTDGINTPFNEIKQAHEYNSLEDAENAFKSIAKQIKLNGLPESITPLLVGIAGYGNVSAGVQKILDLLPIKEINANEVTNIANGSGYSAHHIYKVVFKEEDMVEPKHKNHTFKLEDYYQNPKKYKSKFENYIPYLSVFVNAVFWDTPYPRFVTKEYLKKLYEKNKNPKLQVIGDISCDIQGGVECTLKPTDPGNPVYIYDPQKEIAIDGFKGNGPVIMAVEILPSEIPRESSIYFSSILSKLLPKLVDADFNKNFDDLKLPYEIKNAIIAFKGVLVPQYEYIEKYL